MEEYVIVICVICDYVRPHELVGYSNVFCFVLFCSYFCYGLHGCCFMLVEYGGMFWLLVLLVFLFAIYLKERRSEKTSRGRRQDRRRSLIAYSSRNASSHFVYFYTQSHTRCCFISVKRKCIDRASIAPLRDCWNLEEFLIFSNFIFDCRPNSFFQVSPSTRHLIVFIILLFSSKLVLRNWKINFFFELFVFAL